MGVFSTVVDIMSTMEGYLEYRGGCSVPWGISWCTWGISWVPWRVFSTMRGIFCHLSTPQYWTPPQHSWYPPTVLKFQRMVSPHGTEDPHGTQDNLHGTHDILHSTEHPTVLKISPTVLKISPKVLNTPTVLSTPHGTAHTLYRVTQPNTKSVNCP